jgi:hypothetical protein
LSTAVLATVTGHMMRDLSASAVAIAVRMTAKVFVYVCHGGAGAGWQKRRGALGLCGWRAKQQCLLSVPASGRRRWPSGCTPLVTGGLCCHTCWRCFLRHDRRGMRRVRHGHRGHCSRLHTHTLR